MLHSAHATASRVYSECTKIFPALRSLYRHVLFPTIQWVDWVGGAPPGLLGPLQSLVAGLLMHGRRWPPSPTCLGPEQGQLGLSAWSFNLGFLMTETFQEAKGISSKALRSRLQNFTGCFRQVLLVKRVRRPTENQGAGK